MNAPIRESGDIAGSGACKLVGPAGEVELTEGVIAAKRHIHMTPADAEEYGVKDKDVVSVKVDTDGRSLIFGDVVVRVSDKYALAMHIDTDESNAAGCGRAQMGEIVVKPIAINLAFSRKNCIAMQGFLRPERSMLTKRFQSVWRTVGRTIGKQKEETLHEISFDRAAFDPCAAADGTARLRGGGGNIFHPDAVLYDVFPLQLDDNTVLELPVDWGYQFVELEGVPPIAYAMNDSEQLLMMVKIPADYTPNEASDRLGLTSFIPEGTAVMLGHHDARKARACRK